MSTHEFELKPPSGWKVLPQILAAGLLDALVTVLLMVGASQSRSGGILYAFGIAVGVILFLGIAFMFKGVFSLAPNTAIVVTLFGVYKGTVKVPGLYWLNPFCTFRPISLRVRNLNTQTLKVNDHRGSPIEIAAVVVWQVVDTYRAKFEVDDYKDFVNIQCESAVRHLASSFPYDAHGEAELSLRGSQDDVSRTLMGELQDRLQKAGVVVQESRLSHLAYAPEVAGAMLRRQQADAVVAARFRIVEGAVGMVESALEHLERNKTIALDEERRAAMVSNLMVVLCADHGVQPVVNTGTLYT
jgi:regulator of protease activity HflC (stomatin/prohibitin superfamily)